MVIHHWDDVSNLCEKIENRNNLILFVNNTKDCRFVKNVILCYALFGLFLIEPFCFLVKASNHLDLCKAFPSLFADLKQYQQVAIGILGFSSSSIPTLEPHYKKVVESQIYPKRWIESLQAEIDGLDDEALEVVRNILGLFSFQCAATLKRQRGNEYGFGITDSPSGE